MLPGPGTTSGYPGENSLVRRLSMSRRYKYLQRIFKWRHMDFEFALWQMIYLCCSPKKVYRNFHYHRETKNQWARDDPAFLVLLSFWLCGSTVVFALALQLHFIGFIKFLLWVVFVDCIGVGLVIAGILWIVTNRYLRMPGKTGREIKVEFGYAFDVHLNAFFPLLLILHVVQLLCLLLNPHTFAIRLVGNSLWLIALTYYFYITFLGYSALPFLRGTVILMYPIAICFILYFVSFMIPWNITKTIMDFYKYRVLNW